MEENKIPDRNLFMMCKEINPKGLSDMPTGFTVRSCRRDELDVWKAMHFDDPHTARLYYNFMTEFFKNVYGKQQDEFFQRCLMVCDSQDHPVGSCFVWKAYGRVNTLHWYKVIRSHEGRGIGRALLSTVMKSMAKEDYPVYLHTHPSSYRAIKLYSDVGFELLSDLVIGNRQNDLAECLPILKEYMPEKDFKRLRITAAPEDFLAVVGSSKLDEF